MVPPYGYNSRKSTFLPPYSHAVLTFMECTPRRTGSGCGDRKVAGCGFRGEQVWAEPVEVSSGRVLVNSPVSSRNGATRDADGKEGLA
jgi:hypothetical protein